MKSDNLAALGMTRDRPRTRNRDARSARIHSPSETPASGIGDERGSCIVCGHFRKWPRLRIHDSMCCLPIQDSRIAASPQPALEFSDESVG